MSPSRRVVSVVGELLITAGAFLVAFLVWQLWWTDVVANRAQADAVATIERQFSTTGPGATSADTPRPVLGDAVALIRIPRFGADWVKPVYEGTTADVLAKGVGHYGSTAGPGQVGNFSLAGHRVTYGRPFNRIAELVPGDRIVVEARDGAYTYVVSSSEVVLPSRTEVIAPVPDEPGAPPTEAWLTLTSCHPQYSAAERYVVHARLEGGAG